MIFYKLVNPPTKVTYYVTKIDWSCSEADTIEKVYQASTLGLIIKVTILL